jgi:hypothetical protein
MPYRSNPAIPRRYSPSLVQREAPLSKTAPLRPTTAHVARAPRSEPQFAALVGVAPIPASSGKTTVTGSAWAVTATPTVPCTGSFWSACHRVSAPGTT